MTWHHVFFSRILSTRALDFILFFLPALFSLPAPKQDLRWRKQAFHRHNPAQLSTPDGAFTVNRNRGEILCAIVTELSCMFKPFPSRCFFTEGVKHFFWSSNLPTSQRFCSCLLSLPVCFCSVQSRPKTRHKWFVPLGRNDIRQASSVVFSICECSGCTVVTFLFLDKDHSNQLLASFHSDY